MARVVFFGTPEFGVPVLRALSRRHQIVAVVTQPDRPYGRGRSQVRMSPVKVAALEAGVERILQPVRLRRDRETVQALRELGADVFCLAAYGQLLPAEVLTIPAHGTIGVHASLLPKYRGAAPVAAALLHGEEVTGVSLMLTDEGMDTGPIIAQCALPIAPRDTAETLSDKLAHLGAELLIDTLPAWLAGRIEPRAQDEEAATYAPLLEREAGAIDWAQSAVQLDRQIRAYTPWPGSFCSYRGQRLKILAAHPLPTWRGEGRPGQVVEVGGEIAVITGEGALVLDRVQMAGRRAVSAQDFVRGQRDFVGGILA
ncbi:MAG: methionyl-tRNA formyltransferase [Chloroflexi bacterium]|nr:methionyl-tRNA formyltransferase [Chloroflexota bacterium]